MKIIKKHGRLIRTIDCDNCDCVFEFDPEDIEYASMSGDNTRLVYGYVSCPECDYIYRVKYSDKKGE